MQWSTGSTSCERCRRRPARPSASTAYCTRVRHAGTSPAGSLSPSAGITVPSQPASSGVRPASRCSCSAITSPLSRRCAPGLACCQSQPPQRPGPAYGQGASTRSLDAVQHLDRVGAQEAGVLLALGHPRDDPLAGQRVPDEEHLARRRYGRCSARRGRRGRSRPRTPPPPATSSVLPAWRGDSRYETATEERPDRGTGHRVDRGRQPGPCEQGSDGQPDGQPASSTWCSKAPSPAASAGPRRTAPGAFHSCRLRARFLATSEDSSWYGTDVTITPGVNSSRPLSRSALWLCSRCSYQWPTTYSGMITLTPRRAGTPCAAPSRTR